MSFFERHSASSNRLDSLMRVRLNRRSFGKFAAGMFFSSQLNTVSSILPPPPLALNSGNYNPFNLGLESGASKESVYIKIDNTEFIDFVARVSHGFSHDDALTGSELVNHLVGADFLMNPKAFFLFNGAYQKFENHGNDIVATHKSVLQSYGYDDDPHMLPIQNSYTPESINKDYKDRLGNSGIVLKTQADFFIPKVQESQQRAVNMSFELGKLKVILVEKKFQYKVDLDIFNQIYVGYMNNVHEITKKDGTGEYQMIDNEAPAGYRIITSEEYQDYFAYAIQKGYEEAVMADEVPTSEVIIKGAGADEDAMENMLELFKLVESNEEKLFIVAAGNYSDDWREVREKLKDKWPKNLIIVGQWNRKENSPLGVTGQINGADIYVDADDFGMPDSRQYSSNATAIVSALANILFAQGRSLEEVKQTLISCTEIKKYKLTDENLKLYDFPNTQALASFYANPSKQNELASVLNKDAINEVIENYKQAQAL